MQIDIIICTSTNIFKSSSVLLKSYFYSYSVSDVHLEMKTLFLHYIALDGAIFRVLVVL